MSAFLPKGRKVHRVKVPTRAGAWVNRTTGTRIAADADAMQAMVHTLLGKDAWDLLDALVAAKGSDGALAVADAYRAWRSVPMTTDARGKKREPSVDARVDAVRALLNTDDLRAEITPFVRSLGNKVAADTAQHYAAAVRATFARLLECEGEQIPDDDARPVTAAMLTRASLTTAFDAMNDLWAGGTVRKRGAGVMRFVKYLRARGLLDYNPMLEVELPPAGKPRTHYLTTPEVRVLVDAQAEPFRSLGALLAGTGIEVSVGLALTRRDVDVEARTIRAAGTKTHNRDRSVRVANWAWDGYVGPLVARTPKGAPLFAGIKDRWHVLDVQTAAVAALMSEEPIYAGYTPRDHRHTFAVRAVRAGAPFAFVAGQMGHANEVLVAKVYGRFKPNRAERDRWEEMASEQDRLAETEDFHARDAEASEPLPSAGDDDL